jgi:DNA-directed RNA polymerase specialized sigma24 family protein
VAGLARGDALLLVALADFSHDEVAQALGIPYGTVASRLSRARAKLRRTLTPTDTCKEPAGSRTR